jgi:hypothetical protein
MTTSPSNERTSPRASTGSCGSLTSSTLSSTTSMNTETPCRNTRADVHDGLDDVSQSPDDVEPLAAVVQAILGPVQPLRDASSSIRRAVCPVRAVVFERSEPVETFLGARSARLEDGGDFPDASPRHAVHRAVLVVDDPAATAVAGVPRADAGLLTPEARARRARVAARRGQRRAERPGRHARLARVGAATRRVDTVCRQERYCRAGSSCGSRRKRTVVCMRERGDRTDWRPRP